MGAGASDGRGGRARIEDDHLAGPDHFHGGSGDADFFPAEEPFLFLKRAVVQSTCADRQCAAMGALEQALMMKQLQVLADGDEGGVEALGKIADEYPAFVLKEFDGLAAAFFVQHGATALSFSFENLLFIPF